VVFIKPSELQLTLYKQVLGAKSTRSFLMDYDKCQAQILSLITLLRKINNSPRLVLDDEKTMESVKNLGIHLDSTTDLIEAKEGSNNHISRK
jgi:SNF2 family DNA or RNA helicase